VNKQRFEAFSDGVFAFAATLLVLGFALPHANYFEDAALTAALLHLWPNLLAYALSFSVIGIMWQNHHALFRIVQQVDRMTVFLNLLLLAATAFIPFATSTLGSNPTLKAAAFLYGLTLSTCATVYNVMLGRLVRNQAFVPDVRGTFIAGTVHAYRVGWATYMVATIVALFWPVAAFAAYVLIAVYYLVPRGIDADIRA
jgi:uncharacterized membrane protein